LLLSGIGLRILNPQIIRYFLDAALAGDDAETQLKLAAGAFLGLAFLIQVLGVASTYYGEDVGWTATNNLRADLMLHCLRLDMKFHHEKTPGEMIERLEGDIADLAIFFAQFVVRVFGNILLLVGILVVLYFEDWRVGVALTVYASVGLAAMVRLRKYAISYWKASREANADFFGFLEEQLIATEDIRSSGAQDFVMRNLYRFDRERLRTERRAGLMNILVIGLWMTLYAVGQSVAFVAGYLLYRESLITLGTVYLLVYYTDSIFRPLREISQELQNLQKAGASIERVEELRAVTGDIEDGKGPPFLVGPLSVEFNGLTFAYRPDEIILNEIDFRLEAGKVLGILGRTGSGKTTITRLLFRLYDPQAGVLCLGERDIRTVPTANLRARVGMVTQEVQIFRATVRDNVTFFDKSIADERILALIEELELADWFRTLPKGLDTELEAGANALSAGEAQLLALARIFLRDPGLVIMDEASSRLDPATEQKIERAIDRLLQGRTGIIVAHRLATVQRADEILILDGGRVVEYGERVVLAHDPASHFNKLMQTGLEAVLA
jgi:ATP-binding cassette subfamily B protein